MLTRETPNSEAVIHESFCLDRVLDFIAGRDIVGRKYLRFREYQAYGSQGTRKR
jgi:hypothetical protein